MALKELASAQGKHLQTRTIAPSRLAVSLLMALVLALGMAGTAQADLVAQTVANMPDVTDDMTKASYWSNKQKDPNTVLADRAKIDTMNQAGIDADGTGLQPLKEASGNYYSQERQINLQNSARAEMKRDFIGQAQDEYGNVLTTGEADAILDNFPTDGTQPKITSPYAIVTTHTTMRCFPTDRMLGLTPGDMDDDNLYVAALRVNEPVIIRAQSVDKNFFLCISSCLNAAWVPVEDVAVCKDRDEWLKAWDIPRGQELVVTGYKVRTEQSRQTPNTADRLLYMGTVLERVDLDSPEKAREIVGTRSAYYNHVCYLPVREDDGSYSKELALIAQSNQVSEGFLPLTKANIAEVAFHSLGQMYGWGGMLQANDCSGYVRDVYKCFGLELARNTIWQMNLPVRKYDLTGLDDAHKAAAIAQMPLGTVLFWPDHEMIYLGQEGGKLYVLSALGGVGDLYGDEVRSYQVKGVAINTLDVVRRTRSTWLSTLTCANIPYFGASEGPADLNDVSFYAESITWPQGVQPYTGKPVEPAVTIPGLIAGTDYQVTFANNVESGSNATVTVTGIGSYVGSVSNTFQIGQAPQVISAKNAKKTLNASKSTKKLAKNKGINFKKLAKVSAKTPVKYKKANKVGGKKIVVNAKTGKVTVKKGLKKGTYKVKIKLTAGENASYEAAAPKTVTFKIIIA